MKFRITLKAFNNQLIQTACERLRSVFAATGDAISGSVSFPIRIKKFCVIRSPHANKASREQFELRIFKRLIDIKVESPFSLNALTELELPYGVTANIKILK